MKLIAVDLELTQPNQKIIQIGAVVFDPASGKLIETFNEYVNPGEEISPYITDLTGITNDHVKNAYDIKFNAVALSSLKARLEINKIGVVWGAGLSNDIRKIYDESGLENPFSNRIIDVKAIYQMLANASGGDMKRDIGLKRACDFVGIGFNNNLGMEHNALGDAFNTMRLYLFLSRILKSGFDISKAGKNLELTNLPS